MVEEGKLAPDFALPASGGETIELSSFTGAPLVIYFYPKDDTPGCTKEAIAFTEHLPAFTELGVTIIGISPDSAAKHDKFIAKHDLGIRLAADEATKVAASYGVWVEKSMYGRTYMGVERATFLIDARGRIAKIWRKVKVAGHAEMVLAAARDTVADAS